jgi:hypothetical protein
LLPIAIKTAIKNAVTNAKSQVAARKMNDQMVATYYQCEIESNGDRL